MGADGVPGVVDGYSLADADQVLSPERLVAATWTW